MLRFMIVGSFIITLIALAVSIKYALEKGLKRNQGILYFVFSTIPWYIATFIFLSMVFENADIGYPFLLSFVLFNSLSVLYLYSSIFKEHRLLFYILPSTVFKGGILLWYISRLPEDMNILVTCCFLLYATEMSLPLIRILQNKDKFPFRLRVLASHFSLLDVSLLGSELISMLLLNFSTIREFTLALNSIFLAFITIMFLRFVYASDLTRIKVILISDILYYVVTALITTLSFVLIFYTNLYLMKSFSFFKSFWVDFSLVMILVLFIQPVTNRIQRQLEKMFRKGHIHIRDMFKMFTKSLTKMSSVDQIINAANRFLIALFEGIKVRIFLRRSDTANFIEMGRENPISVELLPSTVEYLVRAHDVVSVTEIPSLDFMEDKNALLIPFVAEDTLLGFIALEKVSRKRHLSYDEIEILRIFENNLTMALIRANEAERMREMDIKEMQMEKLSALGKLAAGLAHEVRNPLNIIYTSTETVLEKEKNLTPQSKELLRFTREEIERVDNLLSTFLAFSKPKAPVHEYVDIKELLEKVKTLLEQQIKNKDIRIITNILSSKDDLTILGDSSQLFQVLLNLGANALESIEGEGEISFEAWRKDGYVYVKVEDTGKGIPREIQSRIFEPFFTTKESGTGMGLFIVHEIVRSHGGRIEMESKKGKTLFTVVLPKGE